MDSDNDHLNDASELNLGTNPNNPDTNGNGILDGDENYTTTTINSTLGVQVSIEGHGDLAKNISIIQVNSPYFTNISADATLLKLI